MIENAFHNKSLQIMSCAFFCRLRWRQVLKDDAKNYNGTNDYQWLKSLSSKFVPIKRWVTPLHHHTMGFPSWSSVWKRESTVVGHSLELCKFVEGRKPHHHRKVRLISDTLFHTHNNKTIFQHFYFCLIVSLSLSLRMFIFCLCTFVL